MKIVMVNPRELNASAYNPRRISAEEMSKLRRSIREYGFVENVVAQSPGDRIIGGHQRVEAAILEGLTEVPVIRVSLSDAKAKRLNLALNRISGEWDNEKLRGLLEELNLDGEDLDMAGFDPDELERLLSDALDKSSIEKLELKPPPAVVWYLMAIPLEHAEAQQHVAALEAMAQISVQSSRDK